MSSKIQSEDQSWFGYTQLLRLWLWFETYYHLLISAADLTTLIYVISNAVQRGFPKNFWWAFDIENCWSFCFIENEEGTSTDPNKNEKVKFYIEIKYEIKIELCIGEIFY